MTTQLQCCAKIEILMFASEIDSSTYNVMSNVYEFCTGKCIFPSKGIVLISARKLLYVVFQTLV